MSGFGRMLRLEAGLTRMTYGAAVAAGAAFVVELGLSLLWRMGWHWTWGTELWLLVGVGPGTAFGFGAALWQREWRDGTAAWWLAMPAAGAAKVCAKILYACSLGLCADVAGTLGIAAGHALYAPHEPVIGPWAALAGLATVPLVPLASIGASWWSHHSRRRYRGRLGHVVMAAGFLAVYAAVGSLGYVYSRPAPLGPLVVEVLPRIQAPVWPVLVAWVVGAALVWRVGRWLDAEADAGRRDHGAQA